MANLFYGTLLLHILTPAVLYRISYLYYKVYGCYFKNKGNNIKIASLHVKILDTLKRLTNLSIYSES